MLKLQSKISVENAGYYHTVYEYSSFQRLHGKFIIAVIQNHTNHARLTKLTNHTNILNHTNHTNIPNHRKQKDFCLKFTKCEFK